MTGRSAPLPVALDAGSRAFLDRLDGALRSLLDAAPTEVRDVLLPRLTGDGKRLRPLLVHLAGAFGDGTVEHLVGIGLVMELIHTASLFHDDVMDRSETRRGRPTLHQSHGSEVAVFAGAYLLQEAIHVVHHLPALPEATAVGVRDAVSRAALDLCTGQLSEILHIGNANLEATEHWSTIERKTASLFEASCRMAALATNGPVETLSAFGHRFGVLYQLLDDVRDVACTEAELGKAPGSDLRSGTYTLPILSALATDDESGRALRLLLTSRSGKLAPPELDRAIELLRAAGGIERALERSEALGRSACAALAELPENGARAELEALVDGLLAQARHVAARFTNLGKVASA
ncbi:MAG: polyprenyl synthetase family protein [Deltaproteobacteria bacterium]|nr:polyprenyl synthetase family protein [Deltaproteobacteria bacterium]